MRTVPVVVIWALLVLTLTLTAQERRRIFNAKDSSPILVSDGSIHIKFYMPGREYKTASSAKATVKQTNHQPIAIGYQCASTSTDPSGCTAACDPNAIASGCYVSTDPASIQSWTLYLCEGSSSCTSPGTVSVVWDSSSNDYETMTLSNGKKGFKHNKASKSDGGEIVYNSPNHLQSAALVVTDTSSRATTYKFTCQPSQNGQSQECLRIFYNCSVSGNAKCQ